MRLCYVEGKKKRTKTTSLVPILFTDESVASIRILIKRRSMVRVSADNEFVFGCGELYLRGWDTLQAVTKQIHGLIKPQLITPTRTRKLLATILHLMDMTDAELTWVTNHMGHTKDVHFSWYRKEDATIELTKIAKILTAVDGGESLKNKKVDDVLRNVNEHDDVSKESGGDGNKGMCISFFFLSLQRGTFVITILLLHILYITCSIFCLINPCVL